MLYNKASKKDVGTMRKKFDLEFKAIDGQLIKQLEEMYRDYLNSPMIYHVSKFWEKLNKLNIHWLEKDGLNNFKRSVNNNYFNWAVKIYSPYFLTLLRMSLKNMMKPGIFLNLLFVNIPDMHYRTCITEEVKAGFFDRKIYAIYLFLLYKYVLSLDKLDLFKVLEEPSVGNPIAVKLDSKIVSQDICNSYLEYLYIRSSLGDKFNKIRRIVEIGAGYGRVGYVFNRFHSKEIKYIFVDIPPALHIAQWYFDQVAPDLRKFKYREFKAFSDIENEFEEASMCFLLPHQFNLLPNKSIDLIINISSLHEMSIPQIKHYYELINAKGLYFYTKQWLFWVNPEDNISVPAVIYPTNPQWVLLNARINPIHKKFFEAIFEI